MCCMYSTHVHTRITICMWIMCNILFTVHTDVLHKRLVIFVKLNDSIYTVLASASYLNCIGVCVCDALYVLGRYIAQIK